MIEDQSKSELDLTALPVRCCRFEGQSNSLFSPGCGTGMAEFELLGGEVVERAVFAFEVVVREVVTDLAASCGDMIESGHFEFALAGSEPAFRECVVIAVVRAAHGARAVGEHL